MKSNFLLKKINNKFKATFFGIKYWFSVCINFIYYKPRYKIKRGYLHRTETVYFDDRNLEDQWQLEVYEEAKNIALKNKFQEVIDLGCGSAFKLIKYFDELETTGIDVSPTFDYLEEKYPQKNWLKHGAFQYEKLSAELVICSDVIEHVKDPLELIENIKKIKNLQTLIISTPDRELAPHKSFGPPLNPTHMREWSFSEFHLFIKTHFNIIQHYHSNKSQWTQVIIASRFKDQ